MLLRKLVGLSPPERRALFQAAAVVPLVRIALTILPYRFVHRAMATMTRWLHPRLPSNSLPATVAWAVTAVSARVPGASCLTQALAATLILARHGHPSTLRVGVARNDDGTLRAHAWLQCGSEIILGEPAEGAFTPFPPVVLS